MDWLTGILDRVGKKKSRRHGKREGAIPRATELARYHMLRRWVEELEPRELLSGATYGGLTFVTANPSVPATDMALGTLFSSHSGMVTYDGNISNGTDTFSGHFVISANPTAGQYSISATGASLSLPNNLVQMSGASASLTMTANGFSGNITNGPTFNMGGGTSFALSSASLSWDTQGGHDNNLQITASGSLTVSSGQALSNGTFTFERNSSDVKIGASGVNVSLASGLVAISGLTGTLDLSTSGIKITASAGVSSNFTAQGATFNGNLALALDTTGSDKNIQLSGSNVHITVGGVDFTADVAFEQIVAMPNGDQTTGTPVISVGVLVSNVDATFADGGTTFVHLTSPSGSGNASGFFFQDSGFSGVLKGTVTVHAPNGATTTGTAVFEVNTSNGAVSFADPTVSPQTDPITLVDVPAGPLVAVHVHGFDLNVSDTQQISGDFDFESVSASGHIQVSVGASNVSATFGSATLSDGSGSLTISSDAGPAGIDVTGTIAGTVTFGGGGVMSTGQFAASFDASGSHIVGTNVGIIVHNETFTGSFSVDAQPAETDFTITDASLQFGSGLVGVDDLNGTFSIDSSGSATGTVSGTLAASIGQGSFSGGVAVSFGSSSLTLSGTGDMLAIGTEMISGDFTLTDSGGGNVSVTATGVNASFGSGGLLSVGGASLSLTLAPGSVVGSFSGNVSAGTGLTAASFSGMVTVEVAPDAISASGTGDHFTVNGQTFDADFTFSDDSQGLALGVSGIHFDVGGVGALVVSNASGTLIIPADKSGITGSLSAAFTSNLAAFSGNLAIDFAPGTFSLAATGVTLTVGGQSLSGDMGVTVNGSDLDFTADNLSANLGGGLVTISPVPEGTMVPPTTLMVHNGTFSGSFSGVVAAGTATGVAFSGLVSVSVDSSSITASGTGDVLTIAGQNITANFSFSKVGSDLQLHVDGVNFSIGTLLSVNNASGDLMVGSTGVTGSASGTVSAGISNLTGSLSVGFSPGVIMISGMNDKLTFGDQFLQGDFDFVQNSTGLHLTVTNFTADLGSGLVSVTGGSGMLNIDSNSGAATGSISGTIASGTTLHGLGVDFSGSISVSIAAGSIKASGVNDTLSILGNNFSTSFDFYKDANGLELSVKGLSFTLGGVLSVAGASGTLLVTSAGISGSTTGNVSSTLAGLSGTLGVGFSPGHLLVSGTNDTLSIGGQTLVGDFVFSADGPDLDLDITNLTANLGGGLVKVAGQNGTGATAHLSVHSGTISGSFNGYLAVGTGTGFAFSGGIMVAVDSAAGTITASGTGDTVTIGGQSLIGDFTFAKSGSDLQLTIANVSLNVGGIISVSDVHGMVVVGATGISGDVAGTIGQSLAGLTADSFGISFAPGVFQVSATNAVLLIGGQSLGGNFNFRQDSSGTHLTSSNISASLGGGLVKITGGSANLTVSGGNVTGGFSGNVSVDSNLTGGAVGFSGLVSVQVAPGSITASGTNDTLTVAGYQLSTDFSFAKVGSDLELTISHLNFSLGGALTISNAGGVLMVTSAGVSGSANGTVSSNIFGVTIMGTLGVSFAPGTISISGTNDSLVASGQSVMGDFNFTSDANGLHLSASNFAASLGNGLVTVSDGSGTLDVGNGAITGSFSGTLHAGTVGGSVSFDGPINVTVGSAGITASTGAGMVDTLTIGSQTISAGFSFAKSGSDLQLTVSDMTATLGPVGLTDGGGSLIVASTGVSGTVFGTISANFTGFSFTGSLSAVFSPGSFQLTGTNDQLTVGDQTISGSFSFLKDNTGIHLSASDLNASFGAGAVTISNGSGMLDVASDGSITGSFGGTVAAGTGSSGFSLSGSVMVAVAPGSITASGTNDTLTVLGNTMMASFYFHKDANGLELDISHVNLSFGNGTIGVNDAGGTLLVTKTGVSGSLHGGLTASIPNVTFNATNFDISFAPGTLSISGTGVSLTAYGQSIGGNFTFASNTNSVSLHIDNLSLSIGGIVNVNNGAGDFTLTRGAGGGMVGSASGNVSITGVGSGVVFAGSFSVSVGNNTVSVSGTGDTLTLFGQKLSGNFSFTKTPSAVDFHVNALNLNLGGGLVLVTGGAADFTVANGGITGSASGTLSVGGALTGVSFGGTVSVVLSNTGVSVTGTNTQISLAGLTLTADQITFARDNSTGVLDAAITNLGLAVDGNALPVDFNGTLMVGSNGLSGGITATASLGGVNGTVTATFANGSYTIAAGVNASFSETLGPVSISGTIAAQGSSGGSATISLSDLAINLGNGLITVTGGSADFGYSGGKLTGSASGMLMLNGVPGVSLGGNVTITFTPTTISVVGTGMSLTVLGQTLSGNFSFVDNGDGTIQLGATNLSVSLADSVSLTGGTASFTLGKTGANAGFKGTGSGNLSVSLPGVGFSTAFGLTIDNTNNQSLFKVAANPMTITVGGIGLTGSFAVQKVTTSTGKTTVSIVASDIDTFLGDGTTGLHISNAGGSILVLPTGTALDVYGSAALEGIDPLSLSGTLHVRMNNTGGAINQTVPAPAPNNPGQTINQTLTFAGNQTLLVSGTATLGIGDGSGNTFVSLTGGFSFSTSSSTTNNITTTKVLVGAAGINAFLGAGDPNGSGAMGVQITNANLGLAIISTTNNSTSAHTSGYAVNAAGSAALLGIPALSLSGNLSIKADTAGMVHEMVQVPDPSNPGSTLPVSIDFTGNTMPAFAGSVSLAIADPNDSTKQFVSLSGDFSFTRTVAGSTTTLSAAVTNASAFVGVGGTNPIGVQLTGGSLGLVMIKNGMAASTYALAASGNVSIVGLPGLYVGGNVSIESNTTGSAQHNPAGGPDIPTGGPTITIDSMTMAIKDSDNNDVVSISLDATITKTGSLVDINATTATFSLNAGSQPLVSVTGSVEFTLGANGLNLGPAGYQLTGLSILGDSLTALAPTGLSPNAVTSNSPTPSPTGTSTASTGMPASITLPTGTPRKLGPLSLYNLAPAFNHFSFSGGQLEVNVGLKADAVSLALGSAAGSTNGPNAGGVTAIMTGFQGTLGMAVGLDLSSFRVTNFGPTGAFDFTASQLVVNVPNVVNVNATNIAIHYDPKATTPQKLISIDSATITVPIGSNGNGLQGIISPATGANGQMLPGLEVWSDHFQLGRATLKYIGTVGISSVVQFTNPSISITDFSASFDGNLDFDGSLTFAADAVTIGPSSFQLTGTSVSATLTQDMSHNWSFVFSAGTLGIKVADVVSLSVTNVTFNPGATGSQTLLSLASIQASVSLSKLTLTGEAGSNAGNITIAGDGTVTLPNNFSIGVNFSAGSSGDLGWPSWIPIQIQSILLTWPDFNASKTNFTITFSAHVGGTYGPITLDGDLNNVVIDVQKLIDGQFPIVSIDSGAISATGDVFGGTLSASLILGVIKLDSLNHQVLPNAPYDHTVFYAGIEGGFVTPEFGLEMRFGISQNGPLEIYVQADADIPIVPPIGLSIKSLYGGITFDATPFPNITRATDLKNPVFDSGVEIPLDAWEKQLKQEVINQAGGGGGGYLFSITDGDIAGDIMGLDSGSIPSHLSDQFLSNGDLLSTSTSSASSLHTPAPTIIKESAGQEWLIKDGTKYYLLVKDLSGNIEVSKYRFVIDSASTGANGTVASIATITAALSAGSVTSDVVTSFQAYGIYLSNAATVKADAPAPGQAISSWTITDGSTIYHITKDAKGLLTIDSAGGSMGNLNSVIRITAGITLGIEGIPPTEFSATGEVVIETDGKLMFNANATFGGVAEFNFKSYIDLSTINSGHLVALFYFEQDMTVPGVGTFPRLIVAGGAEFGLTDSTNTIIDPNGPNAGAMPEGFGIKISGEIDYYFVPDVSLIFTGDIQLVFTSTQATLTFDATLSANIADFIKASNIVTAAGSFTLQYAGDIEFWGAAEIQFTTGSIPFLQSAGIQADAEFFLRINTDINNSHTVNFDFPTPGGAPGSVTPQTFDLQPGSFGLYAVGELTFKKGPIDFILQGVFDIDFKDTAGDWTFDVFAFAELDLGVAGQTILSATAMGLLEINNNGFAAMLSVDVAADASVFTFDFDFTLFTNTTGQDVTYTLPKDLTAIITQMDGQVDTSSGGLFDHLKQQMTRLNMLYGGANGLVSLPDADTLSLTIPGGMPKIDLVGHISGNAAPGPYFIVQGNGNVNVLNTFTLTGSFVISASADGVELGAQAKLHLGPVADIAASGIIDIGPNGLVAALSLAADINLGGIASFDAAATFEINTTGSAATVKEYVYDDASGTISNTPVDVSIAAHTLRVDIKGKLVLAGLFDLHGEFTITLTTGPVTTLTVTVDASVHAFFGLDLQIDGAALIETDGSSIAFAGDLRAHLGINLGGLVDIDAYAYFAINTFGSQASVPDPANPGGMTSIDPGVDVKINGSLSIFSLINFTVNGEVTYNSINHVFTLAISATANINLFIFNLSVGIGGWLDSTGQFAVGVEGGIGIDVGIAGLHGSAWMYVAYTAGGSPVLDSNHLPTTVPADRSGSRVLYIGGGGHLDIDVFGITLVGVDIDFQVNSNLELYFHAVAHLNFLLFSVNVGFTVHVGSFSGHKPDDVFLGGTNSAAQVAPGSFGGGQLVVNAGSRAGNRNYDSTNHNETITIQGSDYNSSTHTQTIYVSIGDQTQTFKNVSSVVIPGDGGETINIANNVAVPVNASVGSAGGTILNASTGPATLTGSSGNDLIESGSGPTTIIGGGGADTIVLGSGSANLSTAGGNSRVLWNSDTAGNTIWTGAGGNDKLIVAANTPGSAYATGENLNLSKVTTNSAKLSHTGLNAITFTNVPNVLLSVPGGGNNITVGDMVGAGVSSLIISYGQSHSSGNVLSVAGSSGADTYTLTSGTGFLPVIPSFDNLNPAASTISVPTNTIARTGGMTLTLYGTSATSGDSLTINSKGGNDNFYLKSISLPTTLMGNDVTAPANTPYSTYYYVGWQGSGVKGTLSSVTALLALKGGNGTDVLVMDDKSDFNDRTFNLTSTQLVTNALGIGGRLTYDSKIDNFNLFGGPAHNTYVISGTGAVANTQISGGDTDLVINAPLSAPISVDGGDSLGGINHLTINGQDALHPADNFVIGAGFVSGIGATLFFTNFQQLIVNGNGGDDTYLVSGSTIPVYINGSSDDETYTVDGNASTVTIATGTGNDSVMINGAAADITVTAGANVTYTLNGNSANLSLSGGTGQNTFNILANNGALTLTGGSGTNALNTFNILGNDKILSADSNGGASAYTISSIASPVALNAGTAAATFHVIAPLYAAVNITGNTTVTPTTTNQTLTVDGTPGPDSFQVSSSLVTGAGADINYTGFMAVTINGLGSTDAFLVTSTSGPAVLNAGLGNSTFTIQTISAPLTINTGTGTSTSTIDLATRLADLQGAVTITGTGNDTLNISDASNVAGVVAKLTDTTLTDPITPTPAFPGITFTGIKALNLTLGSGADNLTINAVTNTATTVTVDTAGGDDTVTLNAATFPLSLATGSGTNTINAGDPVDPINLGATPAKLVKLQGVISIDGTGGTTTLNLDNTGDTAAETATLTATNLTGLAMGPTGISYTNLAVINLSLGTGGNLVTLASAAAATTTNITGNSGNDAFSILATTGPVNITTGTGINSVTITTLNNVQGAITVTGTGTDTLNIDDTASSSNKTGTLAPSTITGFGMVAGGITYNTIDVLNINLGSGNQTVTVTSTAAGTNTTLTSGAGNDNITVTNTGSSLTTIQTSSGDDTVNVRGTTGTTTVAVGTGANTVNVSSSTHTLDGIQGALSVTGNGTDTLTIDDTGSSADKATSVSGTAISVAGSATITYLNDTGLASLNLNLGSGISSLTILTTPTTATTNITTGSAADQVTIQSTGGVTNLNTAGGDDSITVRATAAATSINTGSGNNTILVAATNNTLDGIQGALTITGSGTDHLTLNDSGSIVARTGTVNTTSITGFGMTSAGVAYTGIATLDFMLGSGGAALTVSDTAASTTTNITASTGSDAFTLLDNHSTLNLTTSSSGTNTVAVTATHGPLTITSGASAHDTVTLGSNQSTSNLAGTVNVVGNTSTLLTIDDSSTATVKTATLSATQLTGLSPAALSYSGIQTLTVKLGSAADDLTISNTAVATTTLVNGGTGADTFTLTDNTGPLTVNTGTGANTVSILATHAALTIVSTTGATNSLFFGNAGLTSGITSTVTLTGNGADTVTVDDSADSVSQSVFFLPAVLSGAAPADINFTGVQTLTLLLGTAGDSIVVTDTAAATTTNINAGPGNDGITITNTHGPLNFIAGSGTNSVFLLNAAAATTILTAGGSTATTIGNGHNIDGVTAAVAVTGPGSLLLDDTANASSKTVNLSSTQVTGLTVSTITYAGLNTLTLSLGTGDDFATVSSTAAGTSTQVNAGPGDDSITVTSTDSLLAINTGTGVNFVNLSDLPDFNGAVTVTGSGSDQLVLDESANNANATGSVTATQITGLSPAPISYTGVSILTLTLGSGSNALSVQSSSASTILSSGTGTDNVTVGSTAPTNGGVMSGINGTLSILGNESDTLTLDDSGSSTGKTITVTAKRVTGLAPAPVNFTNLDTLTILLGSGDDSAAINDTASATTTLNTGAGNDTVAINATTNALNVATGTGSDAVTITAPDDIAGPVSVDGSTGSAIFNIDDIANTTGRNVTVSSNHITGLTPGSVTYTHLATFNVNLGSGNDQVAVNSVPTSATTNVNTGDGDDTATLAPAANLDGTLNFDGQAGSNSLAIDLTQLPGDNNLTLTSSTIDGIGTQATYAHFSALSSHLGSGNNTLTLASDLPIPVTVNSDGNVATTLDFSGDYTGTLNLPANSTTSINIGGSLTGILSTAGSFDNVTVGQDLTGTLSAAGNIHFLSIDGNDSGTISAATIDTIYLPHAQAGSDGTVFSAVQGGVRRSINAYTSTGNALTNVYFGIAYDGSTAANPSAAVEVTNSSPVTQRFDLVLDAPYAATPFDLSRVESTGSTQRTGIRNVVVSGSLLGSMTTGQMDLLGMPAIMNGGVYLPADNLAAISVRQNLHTSSIVAKSIQALAFATYTDIAGITRSSTQLAADPNRWASLLKSTLVVNPKKHVPYTKVLAPTEPLRVIADGHDLGVFTGKIAGKTKSIFDPHDLFITDHAGDGQTVEATIKFGKKKAGRPVINDIAFTGTGGSVDTQDYLNHVSGTGAIGDIFVHADKKEILQAIDAPDILGKVNLFGGKLIEH